MKTPSLVRLAAWTLVAVLAGCNTEPRPGVEIGNPDLDETTVRIVPTDGDEFYQIQLVDEATASVDQFQKASSGAILLDSISTDYTRAGSNVIVQTSFSNERGIDVSASLAEGGQIQSVFLKVDGIPLASCFDDPQLAPSCDTSPSIVAALTPGQDTQSDLVQAPEPETSPAPSDVEDGGDPDQGTESQLMSCKIPVIDDSGEVTFENCPPPSAPRESTTMMLRAPDPAFVTPSFGISLSPGALFPN